MSFSPIQPGSTTAPSWTTGTLPTGTGEVQGTLGGHTVTALSTPPQGGLGEELRTASEPTASKPLQDRTVTTAPQAPVGLRREALSTPTALRATVGEPKRDWKLFGITLLHRSSGYKEVLSKLDSFHRAAGNDRPPAAPSTPEARKTYAEGQIGRLSQELDELERSCDAYIDGNARHTHRDDIAQLKTQVQAQRAQLDELRAQVEQGGWPEGVSVADARAFAQHTPPVSLAETGAVLAELRNAGMTPGEQHAWIEKMLDLPLDGASLAHAAKLGMPDGLVRQYAQTGVPIRPETSGETFNDAHLDPGGLQKLGSGAVNTVFKGSYTFDDGTHFTGVFKPSQTGGHPPEAVIASGISTDRPAMEQRNVAVHKIDQHLGMGVAPRAEVGVHDVGGQQRMGLVMSFAPGQSPLKSGDVVQPLSPEKHQELSVDPRLAKAYAQEKGFLDGRLVDGGIRLINSMEYEDLNEAGDVITAQIEKSSALDFNFSDPVLREKTTDLQWLDALCGQVDRHAQNYIIQRGPDGQVTGVTGIDNDFSFGSVLQDPNDVNGPAFKERTGAFKSPFNGCLLPQVVSSKTASALLAMTPEKLAELMGPGLTPEEVTAAQNRLDIMQTHIRDLQAKGQVLDKTEDWGSERVSVLLGNDPEALAELDRLRTLPPTPETNRQIEALEDKICATSYISRESFALREAQRPGSPMFKPVLSVNDFR